MLEPSAEMTTKPSRPMRLRPGFTLDQLKARAELAEEIVAALNETVRVASAPSYEGGVNDVLALLRGVNPQALLEANVAAGKARLGW